ncbi:MAG: SpoIID/LytB domain-containing protein [Peptococcales bacterium]|jgi:N-acetylmuramoyl-L-alanine amidase
MKIYEVIQTKNAGYLRGRKLNPVNILVHSTGANNPWMRRYVDAPEVLGKHKYNNHWNKETATKSMHAFIGKDINGVVAVAHTLPYDIACWGCGAGKRGSYNYDPVGHIQFEICEDNLKNEDYYREAFGVAEEYCAMLCKKFGYDPMKITSHYEAGRLGYAFKRVDPTHWMAKFGDNMDQFRARVAKRVANAEVEEKPIGKVTDTSKHIVTLKITREENATFFNKPIGSSVVLPLEEYLLGVVPAEIGSVHLEACKAQAIAARTYAYVRTGVGKVIDDTSNYQAYRAPLGIDKAHSVAHQAVKETAGQMLYYGGKVIETAVYSASNGGRMVSSKERWGGDRPYLVSKDDPWTRASGKEKKGHGVGMSQWGAIYAAEHGITYDKILAFYYPGTVIKPEISNKTEPEKSEKVLYQAAVVTRYPNSLGLWETARKRRRIMYVPRDATVDVLEEVNKTWALVRYQGTTGFVDRKYLRKRALALNNPAYYAKVVTRYPNSLGLWKTASKGTRLCYIPRDETVGVLEEVNKTWAKVSYQGSVGFVDRQYLRKN